MYEIPLTQGYVMWVSAEDYVWAQPMKWCAIVDEHGRVYAQTYLRKTDLERGRHAYFHRLALRPAQGLVVDHRKGTNPIPERPDVLDNRRENLRLATQRQNMQGYKSVQGGKTSVYI